MSPRGATDWPIVFSWRPVAGGEWVYRVSVVDSANRVLIDEQDTRGTRLSAPAELRSMLVGRGPFYWQVAIVGEDGKAAVSSEPVPFSLR